jgi:hypothetical protein
MALGPLQASHWPPKCPLRSCPGGLCLGVEVSNHRWTFTALLRERRKARTTWIEQSAFQTSLPAKSLQIRCLTSKAYPKPEKSSSPAPFFGRTRTINRNFETNQSPSPMKRPPVPLVSHSRARPSHERLHFLSFDRRCFRSYIIRCSRPNSSLPAPLSSVLADEKDTKAGRGGWPCQSGAAPTPMIQICAFQVLDPEGATFTT